MFQRAPSGLDQRIRERDLRHGQEPTEQSGVDQFAYASVDILYFPVGEERRRLARWEQLVRCIKKHRNSVSGLEAI